MTPVNSCQQYFQCISRIVCVALLLGSASFALAQQKMMRFVYFVEQGQAYNQADRDAIERHAFDLQQYWFEQFGGTFYLNNPVVDVIYGDHDANWYLTTPDGIHGNDARWYRLGNIKKEVYAKLSIRDFDSNVRVANFPTTRSDGHVGGNFGGVWMDGDDLECILGKNGGVNFPYPDGGRAYCLGHIAHELGHVFGLDHTGADSDCMQYGFYVNSSPTSLCNFGQANRNTVINSSQNNGWLSAKPGDLVGGAKGIVGARIESPAPSANLLSNSVSFSWNKPTGSTDFDLLLGTSGPGSTNIRASAVFNATSLTVNNLPTAGQAVNARLWTYNNGWTYRDYVYTAVRSSAPASSRAASSRPASSRPASSRAASSVPSTGNCSGTTNVNFGNHVEVTVNNGGCVKFSQNLSGKKLQVWDSDTNTSCDYRGTMASVDGSGSLDINSNYVTSSGLSGTTFKLTNASGNTCKYLKIRAF